MDRRRRCRIPANRHCWSGTRPRRGRIRGRPRAVTDRRVSNEANHRDPGMTIIDPPSFHPFSIRFYPYIHTHTHSWFFVSPSPFRILLSLSSLSSFPSRAAGNFMLELTGSMETATKVFEDPRSGRWRVIFHHLGMGEQHLPPPFPPSRGRLISKGVFESFAPHGARKKEGRGERGRYFCRGEREEWEELGVPQGTNARQIFLRRLATGSGEKRDRGRGEGGGWGACCTATAFFRMLKSNYPLRARMRELVIRLCPI